MHCAADIGGALPSMSAVAEGLCVRPRSLQRMHARPLTTPPASAPDLHVIGLDLVGGGVLAHFKHVIVVGLQKKIVRRVGAKRGGGGSANRVRVPEKGVRPHPPTPHPPGCPGCAQSRCRHPCGGSNKQVGQNVQAAAALAGGRGGAAPRLPAKRHSAAAILPVYHAQLIFCTEQRRALLTRKRPHCQSWTGRA